MKKNFILDTYGYDFEKIEEGKWYKIDQTRPDREKFIAAIKQYIDDWGTLEFNNPNYTKVRRIQHPNYYFNPINFMIKVSDIKIPLNYVLIKPDSDYESYQLNGRETGILSGTSIDTAGQVVAVTGTVMQKPMRLKFLLEDLHRVNRHYTGDDREARITKVKEDSVKYDVPIEVERNDRVIFFYKNQFDVYKTARVLFTDEGTMYLIRYDDLFCTFKGKDKFYPLNGYVFIEPIELPKEILEGSDFEKLSSGIIKPTFTHQGFNKKNKIGVARITHSGCICKAYLDFPDQSDDTIKLKTGDYVLYTTAYAGNIQFDLHQSLSEKKRLRIHRKDIVGVIDGGSGLDIQQVLSNFKIK